MNKDKWIFTIKLKLQTPAFPLDSKNKMYLICAFIFSNPSTNSCSMRYEYKIH